MEVYPNSTTLMLTTMAITTDWQPQSKSDDLKDNDRTHPTYQQTFSVETRSVASHDMDDALIHPSRPIIGYDAARQISEILEKTFCA